MRFIKNILIALCLIVFALFIAANTHATSISLFPLPYEIEIPFFLIVCFLLGIGMIIGWAVTSSAKRAVKKEMKAHKKREKHLEKENSLLRQQQLLTTSNDA